MMDGYVRGGGKDRRICRKEGKPHDGADGQRRQRAKKGVRASEVTRDAAALVAREKGGSLAPEARAYLDVRGRKGEP